MIIKRGDVIEEALREAAERLEACGHRATPQRTAVIAELMAQRRYVTAQDLHPALRRLQPHLGLATVYRTLELLVDCGLAEAFPQPNNEMRYAFCSARHHHHLVCTRCGLVTEVPGCALHTVERELERQNRYVITDHTLTFFGVCEDCCDVLAAAPAV
jgi:Fur family transcriptional regulator, ferric uptake regulator